MTVERSWRVERRMSPAETGEPAGGWEALRTCDRLVEALKWLAVYRNEHPTETVRLVLVTVEEVQT